MKYYIIFFILLSGVVSAADLHVDLYNPSCSDLYSRTEASSTSTPWCKLDTALVNMISGDRVIINGGTYNAQNSFSISNKNYSTVTEITCASGKDCLLTQIAGSGWNTTPNVKWTNKTTDKGNTWRATYSTSASSVFVTRMDTNESFFMYSDAFNDFFLTNNREDFNTSSNPPGAYFNTSYDYIYLRFKDPTANPNNIPIAISKQYGTFLLTNVTNLRITNITFKYTYAAIRATSCHLCNFSNNIIQGGRHGIYFTTSEQTQISSNVFYRLTMEDYKWYWQIHAGILGMDNYENNKLSNNRITNFFDGISMHGTTYSPKRNNRNLLIKDNDINVIHDDGIQLEGYHNNGNITHNNLTSVFVAISIIPMNSSQNRTSIEYNILYHNFSTYWNNTHNITGECYKLFSSDPGTLTIGLNITHNTCRGYGYAGTPRDKIQTDITVTNNLFVNTGFNAVSFTGQSKYNNHWDNNLYYHLNMTQTLLSYYNNVSSIGEHPTIESAQSSNSWNGIWDLNSRNISPGIDLENPAKSLEELRPTSFEVYMWSLHNGYVGAMRYTKIRFDVNQTLTQDYIFDDLRLDINNVILSSNSTISGINSVVNSGTHIFKGKMILG